MYAKNNPAPKPITIGTVTKISDGVVQTTGVSVKISKDGAAYGTGGGSLSIEEGEWSYLPTQGETDCESLRIVLFKTDCYSRSITVVFTASALFGYAGTDQSKIANPTATVGLTNTTIKAASDNATQASVNLIPTNPLRDNDARLINLDFPISSVNTAISNLNNLSALINLYAPPQLEIPDSGNIIYPFTIVVRDNEGKLVNLDASPTLTAANASGTSRTSNLSSVTNPATGRYTFTYTVASTHAKESIRIVASGTVSAEQRYVEWVGNVVDYDTLTTLQSVQTTVNSINTRLPASPAALGDIPAATTIRDVIMNSMPDGGWVDGSFGNRWIISNDNQRNIAVTGTHHVAAVLHDVEPNSIPEDAFTANAITRIQSGLALQSTLLLVDKATKLIPALL